MKKSLIALAALAAVTAASAQSTVTLSGAIVLGVGTTKTGNDSSGTQITRQTGNLAIKGTEDLGGGLKANFEVQTTMPVTAASSLNVAGAAAATTTLGDRGAYINVQGGFGTVTVGRTNAAIKSMMGIADVSRMSVQSSGMSAGSSGSTTDAKGGDANAFVIYGDAYSSNVSYQSPAMNGFSVAVALAPVDNGTAAQSSARGDAASYSLQYANGPLVVAYNLTDNKQAPAATAASFALSSVTSGTTVYTAVAAVEALPASKLNTFVASYDLGVVKVGLAHQTIKLASGVNPGNASMITANIPLGAGSIGAGYGKRGASASTSAVYGDEVKKTFVGYRYDLSKRTHVQAVYSKTDRQGSTVTNDVTQSHVLIGHSF